MVWETSRLLTEIFNWFRKGIKTFFDFFSFKGAILIRPPLSAKNVIVFRDVSHQMTKRRRNRLAYSLGSDAVLLTARVYIGLRPLLSWKATTSRPTLWSSNYRLKLVLRAVNDSGDPEVVSSPQYFLRFQTIFFATFEKCSPRRGVSPKDFCVGAALLPTRELPKVPKTAQFGSQ